MLSSWVARNGAALDVLFKRCYCFANDAGELSMEEGLQELRMCTFLGDARLGTWSVEKYCPKDIVRQGFVSAFCR